VTLGLLVALVAPAAWSASPPGEFSTRAFGPAEGMPGYKVRGLAAGPDGTLFVGTDSGIARFDGALFHPVPAPAGWEGAATRELCWRDGDLVAQTELGVFVARGGVATILDDRPLAQTNAGCSSGDDGIVLANELGVFRPAGDHLEQLVAAPGQRLRAALHTADGLLVGGVGGLFRLEDGQLARLHDHRVRALLGADDPLVGTEVGLFRLSDLEARIGPKFYVTDLARFRDDRIAASGGSGGLLFAPDLSWERIDHRSGMPVQILTRVVGDRDGQLWFGTMGGGLVRLSEPGVRSWNSDQLLPDNLVTSLGRDGGALLVTTIPAAARLGPDMVPEIIEGPRDGLGGLIRGERGLYWSVPTGAVMRGWREEGDWRQEHVVSPRPWRAAEFVRSGETVWYAHSTGIVRLEPSVRSWDWDQPPLFPGPVDRDGSIALVGEAGLFRVSERDGELRVDRLADAPGPCAWGTTSPGPDGLLAACEDAVFAWTGDGWRRLGEELLDGGPVAGLFADGDEVWAATMVGLYRLAPTPLSLGPGEGLPRAAYTGPIERFADRLAVATGSGLLWLDPATFEQPRAVPEVRIGGLVAGDRRLGDIAELLPGDRSLRVELEDDTLLDRSDVSYRFRMDDGSWSEPTHEPTLELHALAPGARSLEVQVRAARTAWSEPPVRLDFFVPPHWWQRRDVQLGFLLLVAVALWIYWRERAKRLETELRRLKEADEFRAVFGRFVTPEVADEALSGRLRREGERREVSVLFADIRGFTPLTEALEPEELVRLLNAWLGAAVEVIEDEGGVVNKFMGDAVVAIFGAPREQLDHADRAVRAAIRLAEAARESPVRGAGGRSLRAGVGINSGEVIAGAVGAESRMEYTVIGEAVNVAARVEALTRKLEADVLVTGATVERLEQAHGLAEAGAHQLKGVSEPVTVWRWDDRSAPPTSQTPPTGD